MTRVALRWMPEGKRKQGHPKTPEQFRQNYQRWVQNGLFAEVVLEFQGKWMTESYHFNANI